MRVAYSRALVLLLLIASAACASASSLDGDVDPDLAVDAGKIIFYRPKVLFGSGMRPEILIDGEIVGKSKSGKHFAVDVPLGDRHISVPNSMYSGERSLEITVPKDEIVYIRMSLGGSAFGGRMNVERIYPSQAEREMEGLKEDTDH